MKGNELIKRIKRLAKKKSIECEYRRERGKGSHGTLYYEDRRAIIGNPKDELKKGTFFAVLKQLDIDENELK